jgi:hypothetical protein
MAYTPCRMRTRDTWPQLLAHKTIDTAKLHTVAMDSLPQFARPEHPPLYRIRGARVRGILFQGDKGHRASDEFGQGGRVRKSFSACRYASAHCFLM